MGKTRTITVEQQLRAAIRSDGRALYRIADACEIPRTTLYDWWSGDGRSIGLPHVSALCSELGLELSPRE